VNPLVELFKQIGLMQGMKRVDYEHFIFNAQITRKANFGDYLLTRNMLLVLALSLIIFISTDNRWYWLAGVVLVIVVLKRYDRSRFFFYNRLRRMRPGDWNDEKAGSILIYGKINAFLSGVYDRKIEKRKRIGSGFEEGAAGLIFVLICIVGTSSPVWSGSDYQYRGQTQNGSSGPVEIQPQDMIPKGKEAARQEKSLRMIQNKFELNLDPALVQQIQAKRERYRKMMMRDYRTRVAMSPSKRPFRIQDTIQLSPVYETVIRFPDKYAVKQADSSVPMVTLSYAENILKVKPGNDFLSGNIVVSLSTGDRNVLMQILVKRYTPDYTGGESPVLYTMIDYIDRPEEDPVKILQAYFKLNGEKAIDLFDSDGNFDVFTLDGIPYYLIRDDKFGTIEYNGVNFRIAHEAVSFGEIEKGTK